MELGVGVPAYAGDGSILPPSRLKRFARLADQFKFNGLWTIEHLIQPPTYATSWLDPLTTLATLAETTESIPIGTSILNLPLRDPVLVAQRAATVQHLAERELTLGLGTGYLSQEYEATNIPFEERSPRFLEGIQLLHKLLREDQVTFTGEYYSVENFELEPVPVQQPRILTGGEGVTQDGDRHVRDSVKRRIEHADGWIAPPRAIETVTKDWSQFATHLESKDIEPESVPRVGFQYLHLVPDVDAETARTKQFGAFRRFVGAKEDDVAEKQDYEQNWLSGNVSDVQEQIDAYRNHGFDELILHPVMKKPHTLNRQLELWHEYLH